MKMAKASEKDLDKAISLLHGLEGLSDQWCPRMPEDIVRTGSEDEPFDDRDPEQCSRVIDWLLDQASGGALARVIIGMAILLDPVNKVVDPDADTLELHPKILEARQELSGWQPIDTAPKGQRILVITEKRVPFIAKYILPRTHEANTEGGADWADYDEERDVYWCPEGWYVEVDCSACDIDCRQYAGLLTHWHPLPECPQVEA